MGGCRGVAVLKPPFASPSPRFVAAGVQPSPSRGLFRDVSALF